MTSYNQFKSTKTNIVHGLEREGGLNLVLGWMTTNSTEEGGELLETRYALHIDGTIMKTQPQLYGYSYFNDKKTKWTEADSIPDNAEFIGQYVDDIFKKGH